MTDVTEKDLMAYVDGELPAAEAARVAAAIAADPQLARREAELRQLNRRIGAAFDEILDEPVPDRLADLLRAAAPATPQDDGEAAAAPAATVIPLAEARRRRQAPRWTGWMAIAASLALGLVVGGRFDPAGLAPEAAPEPGFRLAAGAPLADAEAARLVSTTASGSSARIGGATLSPLLTFRDGAGALCRQIVVAEAGRALDALLCHGKDGWRVEALAARPESAGTYRTASGPEDGPVAAAVEQRIAGQPLDADAEAQALAALG